MILFPGLGCGADKKRPRSVSPDTHHVHETVFSSFAGDIVRLPLPVANTTALSYRLTLATLMYFCVCVCVCRVCV